MGDEKEELVGHFDFVPDKKYPYTCPVCYGVGHVDAMFYNRTSPEWVSSGGTTTCRSCNGTGIVWG